MTLKELKSTLKETPILLINSEDGAAEGLFVDALDIPGEYDKCDVNEIYPYTVDDNLYLGICISLFYEGEEI